MRHLDHLAEIVRANRGRIVLTYSLLIAEFAIYALIPHFMGKAIDALLQEQFRGFYVYLGLCVVGMACGFSRRRFDTRTFMRVWQHRTCGAIAQLIQKNVESPKIISRAGLARTYGDFLEYTLPSIIQAVIEISVGMVVIWQIVPYCGMTISALVTVAVCVQYGFSKKLRAIEIEAQTTREYIDGQILGRNVGNVNAGYDALRRTYIRSSDLDATCWGIVDLLGVASEVIVVFAVITYSPTAGTILAAVTYARKVFTKTNFLNYLFSHFRQMQVAEEFLQDAVPNFACVTQAPLSESTGLMTFAAREPADDDADATALETAAA